MKKILFVMVLFAMTFAGCKKQSSLNLDEVKETVTIKGQVEYREKKWNNTDNNYEYVRYNKANHQVIVSVNSGSYSNSSAASKYFTVNTDSNGQYSVQVPVGYTTVHATVYPAQYVTNVVEKEYDYNTNLYVSKEKMVSYSADAQTVTLKKGYAPVVDFVMTY